VATCLVASALAAGACSDDEVPRPRDAGTTPGTPETGVITPDSGISTGGRPADPSRTDASGGDPGATPDSAVHDSAADDGSVDAARGRSLWNGLDLSEWDGDPMIWKVEGGAIVGSAPSGYLTVNSFLIYRGQTPSNFVLTAETWLASGNSGIQYRSVRFDTTGYRIRGYQADMGADYWGQITEEAGRGILKAPSAACLAEGGFGKWLSYEIRAEGVHMLHRINGIECVDYVEMAANPVLTGVIALQYHVPGGFEVRFKNLRIEEL
jgi:hypothetical protein